MQQLISFTQGSKSKGELAEELYQDETTTFDCALPQWWLDKIAKRFPSDQLESFGNLAAHFVYIYDDGDKSEYLMPLTKTGCKILGIVSLYA